MMLWFFLTSYLWACDGGLTKKLVTLPPQLTSSTMTEKIFLETIRKFEEKFGDWVDREYNKELVIFKSWKSNTINAYADQDARKMMITIFGGIARYESMTADSLALVLCHELGHHVAGAPKKTENRWSSAEGQSDYYATMKCLKHFWGNEIINISVPTIVENKCAEVYSSELDRSHCMRASQAGLEVAKLFQYLERDSIPPDFATPDLNVVVSTQLMHPFHQCRLDTYFQGALCDRPYLELLDDLDDTRGVCLKQTEEVGFRPACWFKSRNRTNL